MNEDGRMARLPDLEVFAEKHGLKIVAIAGRLVGSDRPCGVRGQSVTGIMRSRCTAVDPTMSPWSARICCLMAVSFVTNTNWQSYGGENTMSLLTSVGGLLVQHFASAVVGS